MAKAYQLLQTDVRAKLIERQQNSDIVKAKGTGKKPSPPRELSCVAINSAVNLTWKPPQSASDIVRWRVYRYDENTMVQDISDVGTLKATVDLSDAPSASALLFVSSVNAAGVESVKVPVRTSVKGGLSIIINGNNTTGVSLNDTTPAAVALGRNIKWQQTGTSVSAYLPAIENELTGITGRLTTAETNLGTINTALGTAAQWVGVPPTSSAPGVVNQIARDAAYLYVCISPSLWARTPLTVW